MTSIHSSFFLQKDMDTMSCLGQLAAKQHRKPNIYSYVGVKDKRAITYQKITGYRILPVYGFIDIDILQIEIYNASKLLKNVEVGDFAFTKESLRIANSRVST